MLAALGGGAAALYIWWFWPRADVYSNLQQGASEQTITDIDRHFGVTPIFVPQVLNYRYIELHKKTCWPYSPGNTIRPLMKDLNEEMGHAAKVAGAAYLDAPLALDRADSDFVDEDHFAAPGAAKFAKSIAAGVAANCK